jgi:hypothetical protein
VQCPDFLEEVIARTGITENCRWLMGHFGKNQDDPFDHHFVLAPLVMRGSRSWSKQSNRGEEYDGLRKDD